MELTEVQKQLVGCLEYFGMNIEAMGAIIAVFSLHSKNDKLEWELMYWMANHEETATAHEILEVALQMAQREATAE